MFEKLLALFERAVAAYEKDVAVRTGGSSVTVQTNTTESFNDTDREALLLRCNELGITVPPRTKTPTLVKMIAEKTDALAAQPEGAVPGDKLAAEPDTPPDQETGQLSGDPFAVPPEDNLPAAREITKEELLDKAQKFHAAHNQDNVLLAGIFYEHGKVAVFPKIDKQYYTAVYDAMIAYTDADFDRYTQAGAVSSHGAE